MQNVGLVQTPAAELLQTELLTLPSEVDVRVRGRLTFLNPVLLRIRRVHHFGKKNLPVGRYINTNEVFTV
jgi:hypothetical protein